MVHTHAYKHICTVKQKYTAVRYTCTHVHTHINTERKYPSWLDNAVPEAVCSHTYAHTQKQAHPHWHTYIALKYPAVVHIYIHTTHTHTYSTRTQYTQHMHTHTHLEQKYPACVDNAVTETICC